MMDMENTYHNPGLLIDTAWLQQHLEDPDIRIVDLRSREEYEKGHLQNAVHLDYKEITGDEKDIRIAPPEKAVRILGDLGIDRTTFVIAYDDDSGHYAARLFWVLDYLGHGKAAILDGGIKKWIQEKREITTHIPEIERREFMPHPGPDKLASAEEVVENLSNPDVLILDVRSTEEFTGQKVRARRGGHIPGAVNIEWKRSMNDDQTFKPAHELLEMFSKEGVNREKEIVTYCQLGVRASHTYFTLRLLGYPRVRVYNGSWAQWGNDPALPVEK